ncbi:uncharacterized protein EV154DRAFT_522527 [Mucor mucedo]|uniref:uncharacterized protein n=1 Tax=Mucor mucedo TaxID=29922 RepID=UPI00221EE77E|nr:uncharacterized protein EV154DRAFT_522527 [Mucor mucedo]KAI7883827.1 hypothetical protein EV154DRAFT_522527 [Mucor mucedo]
MAFIVSKDMLVNEEGQYKMYSGNNEEESKLYHHEPNAVVNLEGGSAVEEDTEDEDDEDTPPVGFKSSPPPAIQTYSPQLNLSLYSPSVASIQTSRFLSAAATAASTGTAAAASASAAAAAAAAAADNTKAATTTTRAHAPSRTPLSPFHKEPSRAVQNATGKKSPLDSFSSSQMNKMDLRSPPTPQPSQSTSRLMNAFQRLKKTSQRSGNHVVPVDVIKPCASKSSLADKIKNKFQPKKKENEKKKMTTSMPRSSSFSSIRHWSTQANGNKRMVKSNSVTSFPTSTCSTTSSKESVTESVKMAQSLTLTKSISSHRLYKTATTQGESRPRQPLRAVNPNDSMRGDPHLQTTKKKNSVVRFTKLVSVRDTFSKMDYDRASDPEAVCTRLTPTMAQQIKEELNAYKLHEMQVHEYSRVHTHFFL